MAFAFTGIAVFSFSSGSTIGHSLGRFNRGDIMQPMNGLGAGTIFTSCLPAFVMSLSLVVYQQRSLLLKNMIVIIGTCLSGVFLAFFCTSALGKLFGLPSELVRPAVTRYFSVPLAIQSANSLAASDAIAASFAVMSGLLGA